MFRGDWRFYPHLQRPRVPCCRETRPVSHYVHKIPYEPPMPRLRREWVGGPRSPQPGWSNVYPSAPSSLGDHGVAMETAAGWERLEGSGAGRSQGLKIRAQHIVGPSYADLTTVPPKMTLRNLYQTTLSKLREFASVWGQKFVRSYMLIPEASLFLFITRIL